MKFKLASLVLLAFFSAHVLSVAIIEVSEADSEKGIADWLFFLSPAKTTFQTNFTVNEVSKVIDFYRQSALDGALLPLGINTGFVEVSNKNDRTTLILFNNSRGSLSEAFKLKIRPGENDLLEVRARAVYSHLVTLFELEEDDLSRFEFSRKIEDLAESLLSVNK